MGNMCVLPKNIILFCVILSNSLLEVPNSILNIDHISITHRIDQITMASYYGWKFPKISTMITKGCNNNCILLLRTKTNGFQEASQYTIKKTQWNPE
jgi:hypothetical protein